MTPFRGPLRAVILDWAGTTVDYGCFAPVVAFSEAFKQAGVAITIDQAREPMGAAKRDHVAAITRMASVAEQWRAACGRDFTEADIDEVYAAFIPLQLAVLPEHSALIPGTLEAAAAFRERGLKIGSTTGYNAEMLAVVAAQAKAQGFEPDSAVSVSDVPAGRPAPWMALEAAMRINAYPPAGCVKIGDTVPDIEEGLNAGMWTIGLTKTGNEVGLTCAEVEAASPAELSARIEAATHRLEGSGAHYVVEDIVASVPILDQIDDRLRGGDLP